MNNPEFDDQSMEEFFDNLLDADQRREFLARMESQDSFIAERDLQSRIDQTLINRFRLQDLSLPTEFSSPLAPGSAGSIEKSEPPLARPVFSRRIIVLAIAASLMGVIAFGIQQFVGTDRRPFFEVKQLASIYEQNVERGFQPYYECHDMQRFAGTFDHRFGVKLTLSEMPVDRKMLGISYQGGVTRDTVAMLCRAQDEPVMVFIDIHKHHNDAAIELDPKSHLKIFTRIDRDMIFYEVTPLDRPFMLGYLSFPNETAISE